MGTKRMVITKIRQIVNPDGTEFADSPEGCVKAAEANITLGTDSEIITTDSAADGAYELVSFDSWVATADSWTNSQGDLGAARQGKSGMQ